MHCAFYTLLPHFLDLLASPSPGWAFSIIVAIFLVYALVIRTFGPNKHKKRPALSADLRLAWQRPTLTGGDPQLPSALKSLTSVFGKGTGVTSSPSLPDNIFLKGLFLQN